MKCSFHKLSHINLFLEVQYYRYSNEAIIYTKLYIGHISCGVIIDTSYKWVYEYLNDKNNSGDFSD